VPSKKKHLAVVASVIFEKHMVYCFKKRPHKYEYLSNRFEFPGGKIEFGENREDALKREIFEELNIKINVLNELLEFDFEYPDFSLTMTCFKCEIESGEIKLSEHTDVVLQPIDKLDELDWLPADVPAVEFLMRHNHG
jgi:8-oxo-dGTP diphosphatase